MYNMDMQSIDYEPDKHLRDLRINQGVLLITKTHIIVSGPRAYAVDCDDPNNISPFSWVLLIPFRGSQKSLEQTILQAPSRPTWHRHSEGMMARVSRQRFSLKTATNLVVTQLIFALIANSQKSP